MTVYVSPIGYDSTRVTRPVLSKGINEGDQIILLRPDGEEDDKRATEAISDVERMIQQVQPDVEVTKRAIPPTDFQGAVLACSRLITEIDDELVVNFGGGPRELYLAIGTAALAHPDAVDKTIQFSDLDGSVKEIPLPRITESIPESAAETLDAVVESESGLGIPELSNKLDRAKSTISRHVRQLEAADAITAEMHGKTKYVKPTFSGELRSRMKTVESN